MEGIHQTKDIASCRWAAPRGSPGTDIQMNRASIDLTFCFLLRPPPAQYRRITRTELKNLELTIHAGPQGGLAGRLEIFK